MNINHFFCVIRCGQKSYGKEYAKPVEKIIIMNTAFKNMLKKCPFYTAVEDGIALWQVSPFLLKNQKISFNGLHSIFFVFGGNVTVKIDKHDTVLSGNCFMDIIGNVTVTLTNASDGAECYNIILTEEFLMSVLRNKRPFPLSYVLENQNKPVIIQDGLFASILRKRLLLLYDVIQENEHYFYREMTKAALAMILLDMSNIYILQVKNERPPHGGDRRVALFNRFLQLSNMHIKENHTVTYYADLISITPQYLDRIVKSLSKMTVYQLLQRNMIGECIKLLKDTDMTIQQIAAELNFSDQATFAKYFKRYTGKTPSEYRGTNNGGRRSL